MTNFDNRVKLTRGDREFDDVSDFRYKNRCAILEKPSGDETRIRLLVRNLGQLDKALMISDSEITSRLGCH